MLIKHNSITSQEPGSQDFWQTANSVLNKGKSAINLFNTPDMLSSVSDKAKLCAKYFSKRTNLDESSFFSGFHYDMVF